MIQHAVACNPAQHCPSSTVLHLRDAGPNPAAGVEAQLAQGGVRLLHNLHQGRSRRNAGCSAQVGHDPPKAALQCPAIAPDACRSETAPLWCLS